MMMMAIENMLQEVQGSIGMFMITMWILKMFRKITLITRMIVNRNYDMIMMKIKTEMLTKKSENVENVLQRTISKAN